MTTRVDLIKQTVLPKYSDGDMDLIVGLTGALTVHTDYSHVVLKQELVLLLYKFIQENYIENLGEID